MGEYDDRYIDLANAVILQAVKDWRGLVKGEHPELYFRRKGDQAPLNPRGDCNFKELREAFKKELDVFCTNDKGEAFCEEVLSRLEKERETGIVPVWDWRQQKMVFKTKEELLDEVREHNLRSVPDRRVRSDSEDERVEDNTQP